ncbi:MAG: phosphatidate cytidylyltransferase [Actinomycetales bacterium]|nr:phosphatidate cytidylyltransferase [Candidatus Nanopelagicales bacterium]NQW31932.1 phosphatidate cytidylyltransferase [Actinomycetales bacterium]
MSENPKIKAGRNLPAAVASGLVLAILVIVSLVTIKWLFGVLAVAALLVAVHEFVSVLRSKGIHVARTPVYIATAAIPSAAYLWGLEAQLAATGIAILAVMMWRLRRGAQGFVADISVSVMLVAYLPFMAAFLMLTLSADNGPWRVFVFILLTVSNDIGGYAVGVLFGKHPIAPQISPKKSWEGLFGSVVLQSVVGIVAFIYIFDAPWWQGLIAGVVLTVSATGGDFIESAVKRDLGVKDMGTVVPGHGGIMDRLDSLVPNAFVSWVLFSIFLGSGA